MIIDLIVVVILLISACIAFLRGFIREVLTILGVVGGVAASYAVGPHLVPIFNGWLGVVRPVEGAPPPEKLFGVIGYDVVAQVLAYGSVFLVVVIVLSIVSHVLSGLARSIGLGAIDRTLGFMFGVVRGLLLLALLYLPVHLFVDQEQKDQWFADSRTHVYIEQTAAAMAKYLPESTKSDVEKGIQQLQDANATREKVNSIDLLKQNGMKPGDKVPPQPEPSSNEAVPQGTNDQGYDAQQRQQMDDLINRQTAPQQ